MSKVDSFKSSLTLGIGCSPYARDVRLPQLILEPSSQEYQDVLNQTDILGVKPKEVAAFRALNRPGTPLLFIVGPPGLHAECVRMIRNDLLLMARRKRT
jgi:hypothetical protein